MVMAVGFRVKGKRSTQFRICVNQHLKEFIVKGFVLEDERLKNPDNSQLFYWKSVRKGRIGTIIPKKCT